MSGDGPPDASLAPRYTGVRTFARCPLVLDVAGVDVAAVGVPFDTATSFRPGARFGPEAIRSASVLLRPWHPAFEVDVFEGRSVVDYGDLDVTPGNAARTAAQIASGLEPLLAAGVVPIVLGGDHSVALGELRAHAAACGEPVALVLLDAARERGFDVVVDAELRSLGPDGFSARVRARVGDGPAVLGFDVDVVDPAFAPGTGTPEVGGLSSFEALALVRSLAGMRFRGFDVVEVAPPYDGPGQPTALLAAGVAWEFLALSALAGSS